MWAALDWLGAVLLAIFLVAMVVAAWEHFVRQSEQFRPPVPEGQSAGVGVADAGGEVTTSRPQALAGRALSRLGQQRRADPNWIETRPMVNLPEHEAGCETEVDVLVE